MSSLWCGKLNDVINWTVIDEGLVCRCGSLIIEYSATATAAALCFPFQASSKCVFENKRIRALFESLITFKINFKNDCFNNRKWFVEFSSQVEKVFRR